MVSIWGISVSCEQLEQSNTVRFSSGGICVSKGHSEQFNCSSFLSKGISVSDEHFEMFNLTRFSNGGITVKAGQLEQSSCSKVFSIEISIISRDLEQCNVFRSSINLISVRVGDWIFAVFRSLLLSVIMNPFVDIISKDWNNLCAWTDIYFQSSVFKYGFWLLLFYQRIRW